MAVRLRQQACWPVMPMVARPATGLLCTAAPGRPVPLLLPLSDSYPTQPSFRLSLISPARASCSMRVGGRSWAAPRAHASGGERGSGPDRPGGTARVRWPAAHGSARAAPTLSMQWVRGRARCGPHGDHRPQLAHSRLSLSSLSLSLAIAC